jgi:Arc/MetJ-type ribon-helix-helix transcriptional regulator
MTRKLKGERKPMEKLFNLRMPKEFIEALDEAKWTLRKSMSELVREAIIEYLERHLPEESLEKVRQILGQKTKKGGK